MRDTVCMEQSERGCENGKERKKKKSVFCEQCDQIGLFLMVSATIFLSKIAQIFGSFLGYFEKGHSL